MIIPAEKLSNIEFSPVVPIPLEFDVNCRIRELHSLLLNPQHPKLGPDYSYQSQNIKNLIRFYEKGSIKGGEGVWLLNGEVVTEEEALGSKQVIWIEACNILLSLNFFILTF